MLDVLHYVKPYSTRKWIKDEKQEKKKKINEKSCDLVKLSIYVDVDLRQNQRFKELPTTAIFPTLSAL